MKASEPIQRLEELIKEYGDLEVEHECSLDPNTSYSADNITYDEDGDYILIN